MGGLARQTNVIATSLEQAVSPLSGGYEQGVGFARVFATTRKGGRTLPDTGVDVGAKKHLYALLRDLAGGGLGVVVVSDEEDEISQLANRVVIVSGGKLVAELRGDYTMKYPILHMEGVI